MAGVGCSTSGNGYGQNCTRFGIGIMLGLTATLALAWLMDLPCQGRIRRC